MNEQQIAVLMQQLQLLVSDIKATLPTLSERVALAALQGIIADPSKQEDSTYEGIIRAAWAFADAFMAERANRKCD